jgi:hypothetical protein
MTSTRSVIAAHFVSSRMLKKLGAPFDGQCEREKLRFRFQFLLLFPR